MKVIAATLDYEYDIRPLVRTFLPLERIDYQVMGLKERDALLGGRGTDVDGEKVLVLPDTSSVKWVAAYLENGKVMAKEEWKEMAFNNNKNALKRMVFLVLSKALTVVPPWGTLTGVRPTKLPMRRLLSGRGEEETKRWMRETFLCSEEKASLSVEVAKREMCLIRDLDLKKGYSLYVGIPFCPTTCHYCSFPSFPINHNTSLVEDYLDALEMELKSIASRNLGKPPTTVYVGGGTPTSLSDKQLERLISMIKDHFSLNGVREFTVEAGRPDGLTKRKLHILYEQGVGRISINPQTMKQETLDIIGRRHTVEEFRESFRLAREVGFDHINVDVIVGLPGETPSDFRNTLLGIKELKPDGITIHSLVIKRASELRRLQERLQREEREDDADVADDMLRMGCQFAVREGYAPYYMYRQKHKAALTKAAFRENVGFAKEGKECLYNVLIMEERQTILAAGAGAISKHVCPDTGRIRRVENVKNVSHYIDRIDEMIARHGGTI